VDDGVAPPEVPGVSRRIGITMAVDEPWRWFVAGDPNVSRRG
jgi:DNA-3-methyladenine glycosylase